MNRFIDLALNVSLQSDHQHFHLGSVVVKGGRVLSKAANRGWNHAEARALYPHLDYEGATLIVMRRNRKISKPCPSCMKKIIKAKISSIVYTDINGEIVRDRIYA